MLNLPFNEIIIVLVIIILSLAAHEFGHAATAYLFGDRSQVSQGRLTLNPLRHIDVWGLLMLLIAGFGWAKPVMIDRRAIKDSNLGPVLIALAGPFANLLLAALGFTVLKILRQTGADGGLAWTVMLRFITINLGLFVFNLFPIPPLDGSHLITEAFFKHREDLVLRFNRIGSLVFIVLILIQLRTELDLIPVWKGVRMLTDLGARVFGLQ